MLEIWKRNYKIGERNPFHKCGCHVFPKVTWVVRSTQTRLFHFIAWEIIAMTAYKKGAERGYNDNVMAVACVLNITFWLYCGSKKGVCDIIHVN